MAISIELYELFKVKLGESEAKAFVKELDKLEESIEAKVEKRFSENKALSASKNDIHSLELKIQEQEVRLSRTIYITSLVQLLAIIGSILAILKFMA